MRSSGFYWVKFPYREWTIGQFFSDTGDWFVIASEEGLDKSFEDKDFQFIGDEIEKRSTPVSKAAELLAKKMEEEGWEEMGLKARKITLPSSEFFYNRAMAKSAEIKEGKDD